MQRLLILKKIPHKYNLHTDLRLSQASSSSPDYSPINALRSYLSCLPTQTALHSATRTLIRLLLLHTAASRRSSHLILGTSLTSLSINLISGIAQGAGFSVAEEAEEEWNPRSKNSIIVRIVRPLRDVGMKECALWAWWCGLRIIGTSSRHLNDVGKHGIGPLTRGDLIEISMSTKNLSSEHRFYIWFRNKLSCNCLYDCANLC